jgi:murein DD-endopeptidase MepM/ murein hydrolase activator NlpD
MKPLGEAGALPAAPVKDDRHVAAKQLEAFFLRRLLQEARPQGDGLMSGGFAGETFRGMLDEQLADKMAGGAGLGLAELFAKHLGNPGEMTEVPGGPGGPGGASVQALSAQGPGGHVIHGLEDHHPELPPGVPAFIVPVSGRPTSGYGLRKDPIHGATSTHPGLDLAAPTGTPVDAAAAGRITHAGPAGTYGNLVTIRHPDGYETRYAHLSAVTVHEGDRVTAGDQVGNVGTTGRSTGPHLHFEVRHDGKTMDPADLLPPLNRSPGRPNR